MNHFKQEKWAKVPSSALEDKRLTANDIRVFGMIAIDRAYERGSAPKPIRVGMRKLAKALGISQPTVSRCINHLVECGHLRKQVSKRGSRAVYEFVSDVFLHVDRRGNGIVVVTGYSGVPKHVGVVPEPTRPVRTIRLKESA